MKSEGLNDRNAAAMRSPINWALLGLLIQRPSYGYGLMQRFERAFCETIELSSRSQVYTALDSLARRGLIEHVEHPREHERDARGEDPLRQPKLHYTATQAGIRAYEAWLIEQVSDDERRSRVIARHFAALAPEHALRVLERCAEVCLDVAGRLAPEEEQPGEHSGALAKRLALEEERLRAGAVLNWIDYARSELGASASRTRR